jgi:transcription initiation factor TFIIB
MGLHTVIGRTYRDASGRKIGTAIYATVQRLSTWDSKARIDSYSVRSRIQAFNELER